MTLLTAAASAQPAQTALNLNPLGSWALMILLLGSIGFACWCFANPEPTEEEITQAREREAFDRWSEEMRAHFEPSTADIDAIEAASEDIYDWKTQGL